MVQNPILKDKMPTYKETVYVFTRDLHPFNGWGCMRRGKICRYCTQLDTTTKI